MSKFSKQIAVKILHTDILRKSMGVRHKIDLMIRGFC